MFNEPALARLRVRERKGDVLSARLTHEVFYVLLNGCLVFARHSRRQVLSATIDALLIIHVV